MYAHYVVCKLNSAPPRMLVGTYGMQHCCFASSKFVPSTCGTSSTNLFQLLEDNEMRNYICHARGGFNVLYALGPTNIDSEEAKDLLIAQAEIMVSGFVDNFTLVL